MGWYYERLDVWTVTRQPLPKPEEPNWIAVIVFWLVVFLVIKGLVS